MIVRNGRGFYTLVRSVIESANSLTDSCPSTIKNTIRIGMDFRSTRTPESGNSVWVRDAQSRYL